MGRASESVESNEFHAFAINRMADRRLMSHVDIVQRSNSELGGVADIEDDGRLATVRQRLLLTENHAKRTQTK